MSEGEVRQAIEEPALRAGCEFEPGLVEAILEDVRREPGALPLLQHALRQLWIHREDGRRLTHAAYDELGKSSASERGKESGKGRLEGALKIHADEVFDQLSAEDQELCRRVFLRLVHPGEGAEDTKRRVDASELMGLDDPERTSALLTRLAGKDSRLLVTEGDPTEATAGSVEVAHEALIRSWSRIREWIEVDRAGLRTHRHLTKAAGVWKDNGRKPGYLHTGAWLAVAKDWAAKHEADMTPLEREFLDASVTMEEDDRARALAEERERTRTLAALAQAEKEKAAASEKLADSQSKSAAKNRRYFRVTAILLLLSLIAATIAAVNYSDAESARASEQDANEELRGALRESEMRLARATLEEGKAWLERARVAQQRGAHLSAIMLAGRSVGFSGYGREEAPTDWWEENGENYPLLLAREGDKEARVGAERRKERLEAHKLISSLKPRCLPVWSSPVHAHHHRSVLSVAFSPDGTRLVSGSYDETIKLWDVASGEEVATLEGHPGPVVSVVFSPDGSRLASGSEDKSIKLWDVASGEEVATLAGHSKMVMCVAFSPDGTRLASGAVDESIKLWDVVSGEEVATLAGHSEPVISVAFSPDGTRLASGSSDRTIKLWDVRGPNLVSILTTGLMSLEDQTVSPSLNSSLVESRTFSPVMPGHR